ncbi:mandelate racemase/muconate lactonizing enzyme family protein [Arthrobacter sp. MYb213]|uniref:mandelate racemase/muconate lactonizing enzyme family protein n=1 Tax=Arthrobacter sp. MYb213 TaxID=1848595 RepID=UPI0011B0622F|nr:mandelate racemase/muconate lactonizing enzyme family protein [Arthrobacter sp. MYb213]
MPFDAGRQERSYSIVESVDAFNASSRGFTHMESLMVKVRTKQGLTGWGEAFGHKSNPATWASLEHIVGPFFIGRHTDIAEAIGEAEYAFHAFGRTGPVHYALSAIDIALWDIAAQQAGVTLREYLEPGARNHVNAYASLVHYAEDPLEVSHHVSQAQQLGFKAFKLHESTPAAIAAARESAGDAALMVDVNCAWSLDGARQAMEQLEELQLLWVEEPIFPPDATAALRELNSQFSNVSAGENHSGVAGLIDAMGSGALSFAQPSVGKIGGISGMLEVRRAGKRLGIPVIPHCFYYGPALLATAQLVALDPPQRHTDGRSLPELEIPFVNWEHTLHSLHAPHQSGMDQHGVVQLPQRHGLGFEPDEQMIETYLVKRLLLI